MQLSVPVIGILRGISFDFFGDVMASSFDAGLQTIEVTFNTDRAEEIISAHRKHLPPGKMLGMGNATKGGVGTASMEIGGGVLVGAIVVVNAVGDVIDPATNQILAGARRFLAPDGVLIVEVGGGRLGWSAPVGSLPPPTPAGWRWRGSPAPGPWRSPPRPGPPWLPGSPGVSAPLGRLPLRPGG